MSKELQIPLLTELISRGEPEVDDLEVNISEVDDREVHTPDEQQIVKPHYTLDHFDISKPEPVDLAELENDESLEDFSSVQELLIEEEVRMILDKHMEHAYEEIIRLIHNRLNHRLNH